MTPAERRKALNAKYERARQKKRTNRIIECEDRISRLTSFIATMETERLRLLAEVVTLRMKED